MYASTLPDAAPGHLPAALDYAGRVANYTRAWGYVSEHDAHCSDPRSITHGDSTENLCVGTYLDAIADSRHWATVRAIANGDTVPDGALRTNARPRMNEDTPEMVDP
jgi:hypothetical protein